MMKVWAWRYTEGEIVDEPTIGFTLETASERNDLMYWWEFGMVIMAKPQ